MKAFTVLFLLSFITFLSCDDNLSIDDCDFEQIDENQDGKIDDNERSLMNACKLTGFESKSEIEENLIGDWILVGHGEGWSYKPSQPCASISFSDDELVYNISNANLDSQTTHTWEIELIEWFGGEYFQLKTEPTGPVSLAINNFCEEYMYLDHTPTDGNMYLYMKVN